MAFRVGFSNVGMAASALCAVHCAALPLLAMAGALNESAPHSPALHSPAVEGTLVGVAALVGYGTLIPGFRIHGRALPLLLITGGLALLLGAHTVVPEGMSFAASLTGAALLIGAQLLNRRCPAPCCAAGQPHTHS